MFSNGIHWAQTQCQPKLAKNKQKKTLVAGLDGAWERCGIKQNAPSLG